MKFFGKMLALKEMKLKRKMLVAYAWCVIFPLAFLSISHCLSIVNNVNRNNIRDITASVSNVCEGIENIFDNALLVSDAIYYDEDIQRCLTMQEGSMQDFIDNAKSIDELNVYQTIYDYIESMELYSKNEKLYKSEVLRHISSLSKKDEWYQTFMRENEEVKYISYYDENKQKSTISIVRNLNYFGESVGILKINISYQAIAQLLRFDTTKGQMYFLDSQNRCIALANNSEENIELYSFMETKPQSIEKKLDMPEGYKVYCEYTNTNVEETIREIVFFLLMMTAIVVLSLYVGYKIIYTILLRINKLSHVTSKMQKGEFEKVDEAGLDNDEIANLTRGLNAAVDKIDNLINEVYRERISNIEKEKEKRTAEFIALQNQVNPHFIFNILESLHMKLFMRGDTEASKVIQSMAVTFRKLLDWKSDTITLKDEMGFINAFIDLSCFNMEKDIALDVKVEDKILNCQIPKMSVQVFVENAFRHGLENTARTHPCMFALNAFSREERLIVEISDNGCGMDEALTGAINTGDLEYIKKRGVGIFNVFMRLGLLFGKDFSIQVTSVPYEETKVTLNLPMKFEAMS